MVRMSGLPKLTPFADPLITAGFPIKHGQLEAVTAPSPVQPSIRLSTHLSIQEDEDEADDSAFLSPAKKRYGYFAADAVRSSCLTTSDMSQMSGLFDFPLPPSTRPGGGSGHTSLLQAYFETAPSESESQRDSRYGDEPEAEQADRHTDSEEDVESFNDVEETLHALRTSRVTSFESRMTFGGSEDMEFITQPVRQVHR